MFKAFNIGPTALIDEVQYCDPDGDDEDGIELPSGDLIPRKKKKKGY